MATTTVNKIVPPPQYEVTLKMTGKEATTLRRLLGNHIRGKGPTYRLLEGIWQAIAEGLEMSGLSEHDPLNAIADAENQPWGPTLRFFEQISSPSFPFTTTPMTKTYSSIYWSLRKLSRSDRRGCCDIDVYLDKRGYRRGSAIERLVAFLRDDMGLTAYEEKQVRTGEFPRPDSVQAFIEYH